MRIGSWHAMRCAKHELAIDTRLFAFRVEHSSQTGSYSPLRAVDSDPSLLVSEPPVPASILQIEGMPSHCHGDAEFDTQLKFR